MKTNNNNEKKYNIIIRQNHIMYNVKTLFDEGSTIKIPSYLITDIVEGKKTLLIRRNHEETLGYYSPEEVKKNILSIESKIYTGKFRNQPVEYNLVKFKL